jgi:hypothetical protein
MWIMVGILGGGVALTSVMFLLGNVHHATRTEVRLNAVGQTSEHFTPTLDEYKAACEDAKYLWHAMGNETNAMAAAGIGLIVLSICGCVFTSRIAPKRNAPEK